MERERERERERENVLKTLLIRREDADDCHTVDVIMPPWCWWLVADHYSGLYTLLCLRQPCSRLDVATAPADNPDVSDTELMATTH